MFFSEITALSFMYSNPKPNFSGLPPYLPRYFGRNFPKVLISFAGKYKFAIVLYRIILLFFHTLY